MTDDLRITQEELVGIFGDTLPMDVSILLQEFQGPISSLRMILDERGKAWAQQKAFEQSYDELAQDYHDLSQQADWLELEDH